MAINFPNSPSEGDTWTHNGKTWTYSDGSWRTSGGSGGGGGGVQSSITDGTKSISFNNSNEVVINTDLNVDAINISGHILPSSNAQFDLGNAEYKIRHLFLSDNSLRFGKDGTADISGQYVSFGKDNLDRNAEVYTDADGVTLPNLQSAGKKGDIRIIGDQMHICIQTAENDNVSTNWYNATPSTGGGGSYSNSSVDAHLNRVSANANQALTWSGTDYVWSDIPSAYSNTDVDTHLNKSSASANQVLSWTGTDYAWITQSSGGGSYSNSSVDAHLNIPASMANRILARNSANNDYEWVVPYSDTWVESLLNSLNKPAAGTVLSWNGSDYAWVAQSSGGGGGGTYGDSDVNTHLNTPAATTGTNYVLTWTGYDYQWINTVEGYIDNHLRVGYAGANQVLSWTGTDYAWVAQSSGNTYGDSDVDTHLNIPASAANRILARNNANNDYEWIVPYQDGDVDAHLNRVGANANQVLSWTGTDYAWVDQSSGGGGSSYTDSDVDTHLNKTSYITSGHVLSWNGSDYAWVAQSGGGGGGSYSDSDVNTLLGTSPAAPSLNYVLSWGSGGYTWVAQSGGSGGSLSSRTTVDTSSMNVTYGSKTLAAGQEAIGSISGYKSYSLFKISINHPDLWVTIYTDNTSMVDDAYRLYTQDPSPGSGVIAEFISNSSNQDIIVSPTTIGFNMDSTPSGNIYLKVVNIGSSTLSSDFDIELTILQLEA